MPTKEEELRAFLRFIHTQEQLPEHRGGGINGKLSEKIEGLEHIGPNEQRELFSTLKNLGLIEGEILNRRQRDVPLQVFVRLTAKGVNTLEQRLPILRAPQQDAPVSQTINIGSINNPQNVVAGNNNTVYQQASSAEELGQHLQALAQLIKQLQATPKEKEEAQSLFRKILESPLLAALAPTVVGAILASL